MKANEYQKQARRTVNETLSHSELIDMAIFGINGEAGEVAELRKKQVFHGVYHYPSEMAKEIGDVLWYCALLAQEYGYDLETIMVMNIEKLKERYPENFELGGGKR